MKKLRLLLSFLLLCVSSNAAHADLVLVWQNGVQYFVTRTGTDASFGYTADVDVVDFGTYNAVSIVDGDYLTIESHRYKMTIQGFYYGTTISSNPSLSSITITSPNNYGFNHANLQGCTNLEDIIFTNKVWDYGYAVFANPDNITVRANAYDEKLKTWQGHVKCATTNPNLTQNDVGYYNSNQVYVCQINGATSVVIPATVNSSNVTYYGAPDVDVTNPENVKNLTFEGDITLMTSFKNLPDLENATFHGTCNFPKGTFMQNDNLKTITFLGPLPEISGSASEYVAHPENVTILIGHDLGVTPAQLHYSDVWSSFKQIAYYDEWVEDNSIKLTISSTPGNLPVELWQENNKLGSIPTRGGYLTTHLEDTENLVLRVPNQYLYGIMLDGYDIAPLLPSTTPSGTGYDGYKYYTLSSQYLQGTAPNIQVKFRDDTPIPFETQSMMFTISGGPGTANVTIDYADGTSETFDMEHDGESSTYHPLNFYSTTQNGRMYATTRGIEKIVVKAHPATDEFALTLFDAGKINQTQAENGEFMNYTAENDGSGTYTYTLLGENMTSSYVHLTFPGTMQNDVKTTIAVNGNYQVKYFFYDFDMEYDIHNVKVSDDYIHGTTSVSHNGTSNSYGSILIFTENAGLNPNFRVILNGNVIECGESIGDMLRWKGEESTIYDEYMSSIVGDYQPVPCYMLTLEDANITSDSWIIIDDGSTPLDQIVSPLQVVQTARVIGGGSLSLHNSEGAEVASVSEDAPATISWPKGDDLTLAVTLPDGADIANYDAFLFIDGTCNTLQKVDGTAFAPYSMGSINTAHTIILVIKQTGGFETPDIIEFADAEVKRICVANWDTDGDGELSKAEAAEVTTIRVEGSSAFSNNTNITSFDEFQYFTGLTSVDLNAFSECTSLVSIKLPTTIKSIHNYGFFNCYSLSSIILPESLTYIGFAAFSGCRALGYIYIPKSVSSITGGAFMGCNSMISMAVDPANAIFDSRGGCNAIIKKTGNVLVSGCKNTIIPNDIESIQDRAFASITTLTRMEIPASVTSIGEYAFSACSNLASLVIKNTNPSTITVGTGAFTYNNYNWSRICVLTVPYGAKQSYVNAADWTDGSNGGTQIFKEIKEDKSQYDTNGDSNVSIADVTTLVNVILGKPIQ